MIVSILSMTTDEMVASMVRQGYSVRGRTINGQLCMVFEESNCAPQQN